MLTYIATIYYQIGIGGTRAIMAKLGIKCLPILSDGRVEGLLTARDMQDVYIDPKDKGGKRNYLVSFSACCF